MQKRIVLMRTYSEADDEFGEDKVEDDQMDDHAEIEERMVNRAVKASMSPLDPIGPSRTSGGSLPVRVRSKALGISQGERSGWTFGFSCGSPLVKDDLASGVAMLTTRILIFESRTWRSGALTVL